MAALDKAFAFTGIGNAEIACDWYTLSVKNGYETAYPDMAVFLKSVGRRKFLLPIYKNLVKTAKGKALAEQIFSEARKGYHAVASGSIEEIIANANPK
jgi:hypothetical protein